MSQLDLFYSNLNKIRDAFHKYGKLNDSNSKLDETAKFLAVYIDGLKNGRNNEVNTLISEYTKDQAFPLIENLNKNFLKAVNNPLFKLEDGNSIFSEKKFSIDDNRFAFQLLNLIAEPLKSKDVRQQFDIINEAFGHFVRDNFRNNVEDAQYMTPQEVVTFICKIAISSIEINKTEKIKDFVVMDPCCGVGSFLTAFAEETKKGNATLEKFTLIGQDKVPRMLRLTKLNLLLSHPTNNEVFAGNSLIGKSHIDKYSGKVDLILTNPPFGARFSGEELQHEPISKYPLLADMFKVAKNINSEILFIDRCLSLLKNNGHLFVIVPDSVISSAGTASTLRHRIFSSSNVVVRSIIELPTVTFAQAGTRTKTCVLHLQKASKENRKSIFISQSESVGFEVSSRKGATIKISSGINDLPEIIKHFEKAKTVNNTNDITIVANAPSSALIDYSLLSTNSWTPNHYNANRHHAININTKHTQIEMIPLRELASFDAKQRRRDIIHNDSRCISILHIVNKDMLNFEELFSYNPLYKGLRVQSKDLLFSKINPRIPRALIVPDLEIPLTCSLEFEILNTKTEISNWGLKSLLFMPNVQVQINHLTSGTSSSHNRIKSEDLGKVLIPLPKKWTKKRNDLMKFLSDAEKKEKAVQSLSLERYKSKNNLIQLLS